MAASKPSAESDVFRELYARLKDGIQVDLKAIAADLYSRKLISKGTFNSATNPLLDSESRAISLLNAIGEKIMISGSVFWEFLQILEVHRKNLAAELREEFKNKSEQCDGVSEDPDLSVPIEPAQERKEASSRYVPSITVSNRTALTGQCSPQPPSSHRDLPEQAPLRESGTMSPALLVGLKPLLAQLGESDGNEESRGITTLTSAATAAALVHSYGYVSEVQGDGGDDKKLMKVDQAYARMEEYYRQELKRTVQQCKKLEHDLKSTRDELKHLKSKLQGQDRALQEMRQRIVEKNDHLHMKETERLKGQIESRKEDVVYMVEQCRLKHSELQEQDQTLREKDSELQEMKQKLDAKLMERDDHLHRVETELNEVKAQLQQKEMELQQKEMELQQKEQENKLLKYQLNQGVIKQKLLLCERIRELVHQVIKVRNVQEIQDIREQIEKIIVELKASVGRRKIRSWYM